MNQQRAEQSTGMEVLRYMIIALAAILMVGSGVAGVMLVAKSGGSVEQALTNGIIVLTVGETLGVLLLGIAGGLYLLETRVKQGRVQQRFMESLAAELHARQQGVVTQIGGPDPETPSPPTTARAATDDMIEIPGMNIAGLLEEIRDLELMDDLQRKEAARRHWGKRKETLFKALERSMSKGDWASAHARLEELKAILPGDPDVAQWQERISREQAARLEGDLAAARNQVRHSMSISAWEQAEEVVAGLQKKYPAAPEVLEIAANVHREREAFERENVDRLFRDLSDATEHRQWRRAVQVGEEIARRYPHDPRAEELDHALPTLRDNAGVQERKEQEELFKDLLKRQRHEEALAVARSVIEKYPESPSAVELLKLVPKVEEMIREEKLKRAFST
jgi:hypothetical protein